MFRMPPHRTALVPVAVASALAVAGCGGDDTGGREIGTSVADIQQEDTAAEPGDDTILDTDFYDELGTVVGERVTVSAEVGEVLSKEAVLIAGEDSGVEPLLVVSEKGKTIPKKVVEGELVVVTGTVYRSFDIPTIENALEVDLQDELFQGLEGEPYILAQSVDAKPTTVDEEGEPVS